MTRETAALYLSMLREFFPEVFEQHPLTVIDCERVVDTMRELAEVSCEVLMETMPDQLKVH